MTLLTPNYSIPYPQSSDTPDGAGQMAALASAVDTSLATIAAKRSRLIAKPAQTGSGSLAAGATATIASLTIPDPGFTYHIVTGGMVDFGAPSVGSPLLVSINVGSTVYNTNAITLGHGTSIQAGTGFDVNAIAPVGNSMVLQPSGYTGSQTLDFVAKNAGSGSYTIYTGSGGGDVYQWYIELVPA